MWWTEPRDRLPFCLPMGAWAFASAGIKHSNMDTCCSWNWHCPSVTSLSKVLLATSTEHQWHSGPQHHTANFYFPWIIILLQEGCYARKEIVLFSFNFSCSVRTSSLVLCISHCSTKFYSINHELQTTIELASIDRESGGAHCGCLPKLLCLAELWHLRHPLPMLPMPYARLLHPDNLFHNCFTCLSTPIEARSHRDRNGGGCHARRTRTVLTNGANKGKNIQEWQTGKALLYIVHFEISVAIR